MQATEAAIRQVVQEVLSQLGRGPFVAANVKSRAGAWGVFNTLDQTVAALTEDAAIGVMRALTPVTHSLATLPGNAISMIAGGNTVVVNAHPGGARIAVEGVRRFNKAIYEAIGLENLNTIVEQPTLESAAA